VGTDGGGEGLELERELRRRQWRAAVVEELGRRLGRGIYRRKSSGRVTGTTTCEKRGSGVADAAYRTRRGRGGGGMAAYGGVTPLYDGVRRGGGEVACDVRGVASTTGMAGVGRRRRNATWRRGGVSAAAALASATRSRTRARAFLGASNFKEAFLQIFKLNFKNSKYKSCWPHFKVQLCQKKFGQNPYKFRVYIQSSQRELLLKFQTLADFNWIFEWVPLKIFKCSN